MQQNVETPQNEETLLNEKYEEYIFLSSLSSKEANEIRWCIEAAAKDGYLFWIEGAPRWSTTPCADCPPGTPHLSEQGHRIVHKWRRLCRKERRPFIFMFRGSNIRTNGVVMLDVETMEQPSGKSVELLMSEDGSPVREALTGVKLKAKVTRVDAKRMRVDLPAKDITFGGLLAVDEALKHAITSPEQEANAREC
jgi:hypothetical protein